MFALARDASSRTDAAAKRDSSLYFGAGAGAAVGGGAALVLGAALLTMDLTRPAPSLQLGLSGRGVAVAGRF
jgi:hypothetical protein